MRLQRPPARPANFFDIARRGEREVSPDSHDSPLSSRLSALSTVSRLLRAKKCQSIFRSQLTLTNLIRIVPSGDKDQDWLSVVCQLTAISGGAMLALRGRVSESVDANNWDKCYDCGLQLVVILHYWKTDSSIDWSDTCEGLAWVCGGLARPGELRQWDWVSVQLILWQSADQS